MRLTSGGGLGNTAISVGGLATLQPRPATGTTIAAGGSSSLTLAGGSIFDMSGDSNAGTFQVGGLSIGDGATLDFDIGASGGNTVVDRLSTSGVATDGGTATIDITGFGSSSLSNGLFDLITASSGLTSGSFTLGTGTVTVNGTTYNLSLVPSGTAEQLRVTAPATNGQWIQTGSGTFSWGDSANWAAGIPGAVGDSATFGAANVNSQTINLDQQPHGRHDHVQQHRRRNYNIAPNGFTLTLDGGGAGAIVTNTTGSNTISAPLVLNDLAIVNAAAGTTLDPLGRHFLHRQHQEPVDQRRRRGNRRPRQQRQQFQRRVDDCRRDRSSFHGEQRRDQRTVGQQRRRHARRSRRIYGHIGIHQPGERREQHAVLAVRRRRWRYSSR